VLLPLHIGQIGIAHGVSAACLRWLAPWWSGRYIETSAKTGENVHALFAKLIDNVRDMKRTEVQQVSESTQRRE
jgi:hypothetical protein